MRAGVFSINDYGGDSVVAIKKALRRANVKEGDVVIASIHWGKNWGWEPERGQVLHCAFWCSQHHPYDTIGKTCPELRSSADDQFNLRVIGLDTDTVKFMAVGGEFMAVGVEL
eukprot:4365959-Pyramimonas_sp.AAC.1